MQKAGKGYSDAMKGASYQTFPRYSRLMASHEAMTATQGRLADTIDVFYSAADKASEGAMAAHAYKRAVDDLDTGIGRELVCPLFSFSDIFAVGLNVLPCRKHRTARQ